MATSIHDIFACNVPFDAHPAAVDLHPDLEKLWETELDMQSWLVGKLRDTGVFSHVVPEMEMVDVFGDKARADIGVAGRLSGESFLIAIELKLRANISANAADGFSQAYHYREMCVVNDSRMPKCFQRRSPNLAFSGVFIEAGSSYRNERLKGMAILTTKLRVGGVYLKQWPNSDTPYCISFRMGEAFIFRTDPHIHRENWHTNAGQYLFGSVKRNGSRKSNGTLGERVLNLYPNADLFGEATL